MRTKPVMLAMDHPTLSMTPGDGGLRMGGNLSALAAIFLDGRSQRRKRRRVRWGNSKSIPDHQGEFRESATALAEAGAAPDVRLALGGRALESYKPAAASCPGKRGRKWRPVGRA